MAGHLTHIREYHMIIGFRVLLTDLIKLCRTVEMESEFPGRFGIWSIISLYSCLGIPANARNLDFWSLEYSSFSRNYRSSRAWVSNWFLGSRFRPTNRLCSASQMCLIHSIIETRSKPAHNRRLSFGLLALADRQNLWSEQRTLGCTKDSARLEQNGSVSLYLATVYESIEIECKKFWKGENVDCVQQKFSVSYAG